MQNHTSSWLLYPADLGFKQGQSGFWASKRLVTAVKNIVCQEKEIWLTHLFSAMGVPGDEGECSKGRVV
jgi:hypothetical protein